MDSGTLELVLKTIKDFSNRKLSLSFKLQCDEKNEFPEEIIKELMSDEIGLHLVFIPEEYGGLGGSAFDIYRVSRALAEEDLGIATAFLAISLGMDPIRVGGTPEQKEKWMSRIASEGLIVAYGVTEPTAGSEVSAIRTTAQRITDSTGKVISYKLNGTKQFITNGGVADIYTILAKTPEGPSFFIVEKGTPGLSAGRHEDKHGIRASNTSQVILEDVIVPEENLVGRVEGQGLRHAQEVFGFTRLMVAAFGLGAGISALKKAISYSKERIQYGSPLCKKQGYMHRLIVPNAVRLEAARIYIEEVAKLLDSQSKGLETEGAIAKFLATEAGNRAADAAIQAHGGYGYIREYEVEKIKRDVRITTIYEGTSEIMLNTIGMDRWRSVIQSRFEYYSEIEREMRSLESTKRGTGAGILSSCARVLGEILKIAFEKRLTRKQFVLFKMAEMIAEVESGVAVCRRASHVLEGKNDGIDGSPFGNGILDYEFILAISRVNAGEVASKVIQNSNFIIGGTGIFNNGDASSFRQKIGLFSLLDAVDGLEMDMDKIGEIITAN